MQNLDLKKFQSDVFKRYKSLTRSKNDADLFEKYGYAGVKKNSKSRFIRRNLSKFFFALKVKIYNLYTKSKVFTDIEKKADEILKNPKVKSILCPVFKRRISSDFFIEELEAEIIIIVTDSLAKRKITEELSIERDELLFSIIVHKIVLQGIEDYCGK